MLNGVLRQLEKLDESGELEIGDNLLKVTHLSKELWPERGGLRAVTKRDLLRYYAEISPEMLPFLKDRPIAFVRYPDGVESQGFFQKHPLPGTPDYVERAHIWTEHSEKVLEWLLCNNLQTLLWLGQVGTLEIHPWYSRVSAGSNPTHSTEFDSLAALEASSLDYPDFVVFDLDPNIEGSAKELGSARSFDKRAWDKTLEIAFALRDLLGTIELTAWIKSSGKTGLHVYVPIERRYHYDEAKAIAETLGHRIEKQFPKDATMVWSVKNRPNAVFIDHNQNVRGKTLASPFSPRASAGAPVSFPLTWERLKEFDPTEATIWTAHERIGEWGNPWRKILDSPQLLQLDAPAISPNTV